MLGVGAFAYKKNFIWKGTTFTTLKVVNEKNYFKK